MKQRSPERSVKGDIERSIEGINIEFERFELIPSDGQIYRVITDETPTSQKKPPHQEMFVRVQPIHGAIRSLKWGTKVKVVRRLRGDRGKQI